MSDSQRAWLAFDQHRRKGSRRTVDRSARFSGHSPPVCTLSKVAAPVSVCYPVHFHHVSFRCQLTHCRSLPDAPGDLAHLAEWRRAGRAVKLADMTTSTDTYRYLIGVEGGGSGTRVVLADANRIRLARP